MSEPARRRIREAGLRATAGRVAVYEALVAATTPLRHADLVRELEHLGLDQATVYRNLMDLTGAGLLLRTDLGDRSWRFELADRAGDEANHPHFVCVDCGEIRCLPDVEITIRGAEGAPAAVGESHVQVQLRGLCDECAHACDRRASLDSDV